MTTNPNDQPFVPITIQEVAPDALTLLATIRDDISRGISPLLTREDAGARVLISVVAQGVFLSAFATDKAGNHRYLDLPFTSVYEAWQLKKDQYNFEKGGWISVEFGVENDGFVAKTTYNHDLPIYATTVGPDNWYVAPEEVTEDDRPQWSEDEYRAELEMFPRQSGFDFLN